MKARRSKKAEKEFKNRLKNQADRLREMAKDAGVEQNFLFLTTFDRYEQLLQILDELTQKIQEEGVIVEKTYVKDKPNQYINPALKEYNKSVSMANMTASTLMKIITGLKDQTISDSSGDGGLL